MSLITFIIIVLQLIHSKYNAYAVVYGHQVCVSVKKIVILDQNGDNETRTENCEQMCFSMNQTVVLETNIEEGGKVWKERFRRLCCFWGSTTWLELSIEKPSYKCLSCQGDSCQGNKTRMAQCSPGAGCFSMVFTIRIGNESTVYPVKGCTHDSVMYGRGCWNGCRNIAVNYNMCIQCCYGDGCNEDRKENSTASATTTLAEMANKLQRSKSVRNGQSTTLLLLFIALMISVSIDI